MAWAPRRGHRHATCDSRGSLDETPRDTEGTMGKKKMRAEEPPFLFFPPSHEASRFLCFSCFFFVFWYFILRRLGTSQSLRQMCCPTSCAAKEACVITHVTYLGNSAPSPKLTKGDELTYYPGGT